MQTSRNKKRRLSVQNLETRKLLAADVGFGDMTYGPETTAEIGSVRPGKVEGPVFGPVSDTCPPCELENHVEANTTPEATDDTLKDYRKTEFTITIEPVNDAPTEPVKNAPTEPVVQGLYFIQANSGSTQETLDLARPVLGSHTVTFDSTFAEPIGGTADPGGEGTFTEKLSVQQTPVARELSQNKLPVQQTPVAKGLSRNKFLFPNQEGDDASSLSAQPILTPLRDQVVSGTAAEIAIFCQPVLQPGSVLTRF